jgi:hypothetical protein
VVGNYPPRQHVLHEKEFGWLAFSELNTKVSDPLWPMASLASGGGGGELAKGLNDWGRRAVRHLNFTLSFALQLRKVRKTSVTLVQ